jgi:hypothetical protein
VSAVAALLVFLAAAVTYLGYAPRSISSLLAYVLRLPHWLLPPVVFSYHRIDDRVVVGRLPLTIDVYTEVVAASRCLHLVVNRGSSFLLVLV